MRCRVEPDEMHTASIEGERRAGKPVMEFPVRMLVPASLMVPREVIQALPQPCRDQRLVRREMLLEPALGDIPDVHHEIRRRVQLLEPAKHSPERFGLRRLVRVDMRIADHGIAERSRCRRHCLLILAGHQTTNAPSFWNTSPSTVTCPPSRRSQIMSQWIADSFVLPVSG